MYDGRVQRLFDEVDPEKGLTFGTDLDVDGQLYVAFEIAGRPVRKDAKYRRDGSWTRGEQDKDRSTFLYLSHHSVVALYDILGRILGGEISDSVMFESASVEDVLETFKRPMTLRF